MRFCIIRAAPTVLLILLSAALVHAQTQATTKTAKPGGSVSGRVTIKGKAAPGIVVALRRTDFNNPAEVLPRATTDQDGNYKIPNIDAGAYEIVCGTLAYVLADGNNSRSKTVVLGESENVENINFALVRGGVITGKITDADGRPVIQQQVRLFRAESPDARNRQPGRVAYPVSSSTTDDRGVYRMFGLAPGQYKVAVGRGDESYGGFNPSARTNYKEIYYPDATDQANATVIEVSEASESKDIDIKLGRSIETFTATGRVVDGERGQPVPNVRFGLQRLMGDRAEFVSSLVISNSNGEFAAENLIPGKYLVYLSNDANSELRAETTTFDIIDSDVSGITVRLTQGGSISGAVILETNDKQAQTRLTQLQVYGYIQAGSGVTASSSRSTIAADGSFRLGGLATGIARVNLGPGMNMSQMKGYSLSRIERDGVVQPNGGVEIKDGEQITGIRIFVSYGNATLRGVVNVENGPLPEGAKLFVGLLKPGGNSANLRPPNVDDRGRFTADGIPPGTYELWVTVAGMKPRPPVKQSVVLQDGVITDVTITIDLNASQGP